MTAARKIVVGLDSSPEARQALEWALLAAGAHDEIVAVHAWANPVTIYPSYAVAMVPLPDEDYGTIAQEELDRLVAAAGDARVSGRLVQDRPGPAIVAEGADADLIVVGHRGDGQVSLMLGSTANHVLHQATRPVVVVRGGQPRTPRRVLVGVDDHRLDDGDSESVRALRWAYSIPGVEAVTAMHAWSIYPMAWDITGVIASHMEDFEIGARAIVDKVMVAAGDAPAGVRVEALVVQESPSRALIEAADAYDLVVVGTRGRGGFRGLILGSTSTSVAAHSNVPVAVVR